MRCVRAATTLLRHCVQEVLAFLPRIVGLGKIPAGPVTVILRVKLNQAAVEVLAEMAQTAAP